MASADQDYDKQMDPGVAVPSAPVYAARLNGLLKTLASAESAVAECVKARESLVTGLEKLLEANRSALMNEKDAAQRLSSRKTEIEDKKQEVEVAIMRALGPAEGNGPDVGGESGSPHPEPDRPEMEALTPPGMDDGESADPVEEESVPKSAFSAELTNEHEEQDHPLHQSLPISANGSNKRRRLDDSNEFHDLDGDDDIDPEVAEMLKEGDDGQV